MKKQTGDAELEKVVEHLEWLLGWEPKNQSLGARASRVLLGAEWAYYFGPSHRLRAVQRAADRIKRMITW